jgi:hypothetical protein
MPGLLRPYSVPGGALTCGYFDFAVRVEGDVVLEPLGEHATRAVGRRSATPLRQPRHGHAVLPEGQGLRGDADKKAHGADPFSRCADPISGHRPVSISRTAPLSMEAVAQTQSEAVTARVRPL